MPFEFSTTRRVESKTCPGVTIILRKMTEGRRLEIRQKLSETNSMMKDIIRQQTEIFAKPQPEQDELKLLQLQDEYDALVLEKVNPETIKWGVKQIEGLQADGKALGVDEWQEWPSILTKEVVDLVNSESALDGGEGKNSELPITSGTQEGGNQKSLTASIVN